MGRKRKFNRSIPDHIDQKLIPTGVHFDSSGKGHWYTSYFDQVLDKYGESKRIRRRKKIADPEAKLSDLHKAIEDFYGEPNETFSWLSRLFFNSKQFLDLKSSTQKDYRTYRDKLYLIPTKIKTPIPEVELSKWDNYLVQRIVDVIESTRGPTAAKHTHSFIRRVFRWGINRSHVQFNPATGTELPKLKPKQRLPDADAYRRLVSFAKGEHSIWWVIMELEYLCRMRGIEVRMISDCNFNEEGIDVVRAKGSKGNLTLWNDRLKEVVDFAQKYRAGVWAKNRVPYQMNATNRPLIVNSKGSRLTESGYHTSWVRFINRAIENNVIDKSQRFSPHDLKRLGVTDTKGTRSDKQEASGHRNEAMLDVYDKSVPVVKPSSE